jgi:hypothetical protein
LPPEAEAPHGLLVVAHGKGSNTVVIPIRDELQAALTAMGPAKYSTFLHTRRDEPRSFKALTGDFCAVGLDWLRRGLTRSGHMSCFESCTA